MESIFELSPYYHKTIENLIVAFGSIFQGITIVRYDSDGNKHNVIRVPIEYGPKNKWLERIKAQPDLEKPKVEVTMPRMAFEIVDYQYDASRKVGLPGAYVIGRRGSSSAKIFNPVPYNVSIQLHTLCKGQEDSLKILEQVLPYFSPNLNVELMVIPEYQITKTVPIVLNGVNVEDNYDSSREDFRVVVQTFVFTAKLDLFGPIVESDKIIKHSIAIINTENNSNTDNNYQAIVNPLSANKNDTYIIDELWNGPI